MRIAKLILLFGWASSSAFSATDPALAAKILSVGAISIEPCQQARILADWYARLGIGTKAFHGMYFTKIETAAATRTFTIPTATK